MTLNLEQRIIMSLEVAGNSSFSMPKSLGLEARRAWRLFRRVSQILGTLETAWSISGARVHRSARVLRPSAPAPICKGPPGLNQAGFCERRVRKLANRRAEAKGTAPQLGLGLLLRRIPLRETYFSAVETLVKVVFSFEPRLPTAAMIAIEIPAAISPYSMAVAPCSSARNRFNVMLMYESPSICRFHPATGIHTTYCRRISLIETI
jgi:hypothetical protein